MTVMQKAKRSRIEWMMYVLLALVLIGLLVWSTLGEIARNPSRQAVVELGSYGPVTIQLQISPYPARPTGTVRLNFALADSNRVTVAPDALSFEYGREGENQPVGSGVAQPMSDGSGMLMGGAQFPSVGRWWLRVDLSKDGSQAQAQFTIDVRPAQ